MNKNNFLLNLKRLIIKNKLLIALLLIFSLHVFLRFYGIESRNPFGWDQVDNAWAVKNILIEHKFPLLGMQAKLNSGIFIGPLYYYLLAIFYFITNLDPIASGVFAGLTSVFTFFTIFYITKKLFSYQISLVAVFIYTVSSFLIDFDRTQWPVNFIIPFSLIIFYCLFKLLNGKEKYLILLLLFLSLSFHIHFTSIFYIPIILFSLPFFPWNRKLLKYLLISLPLFLILLSPIFIAEFSSKNHLNQNLTNYLTTYYHGFHLTRVIQLSKDAFIEFESLLIYRIDLFELVKPVKYLFLPIFIYIYFFKNKSRETFIVSYLLVLWFVVPWIIFSTYKGEISNYYFSLTIPMVLMIFAFLSKKMYEIQKNYLKLFIIIFWAYYSFINIKYFLLDPLPKEYRLEYYHQYVSDSIQRGTRLEFQEGSATSYIYYVKTRK